MSAPLQSRLTALGITLPPAAKPVGAFVDVARAGNLLFLSGKGPRQADGTLAKGKVGAEISAEQAREHARLAGISLLASLQAEIGDLEKVRRVVKIVGFVNAMPDFQAHPAVVDGCSELFMQVFGERGRHARSAVGVSSLPFNITVEIEAIFEIAG
jgi:enamine deaminase RidA (YjgF/YER057c/UK114 family)